MQCLLFAHTYKNCASIQLMSAAKSLDYTHQRPTNPVQVHTESENYPKLHHVRFVYKHDKHGFRSETEKIFSGFVTD